MADENIGVSQQTLVSNSGKNGNKPRKWPQYVAGLASTLGGLAAGMVIGWSSTITVDETRVKTSDENDVTDFSWISSIFSLGATTICLPIGILSDWIGRKTAMLVMVVPFTIGWGCVICHNSVATLTVGHYILGLSSGAFCVGVPIYTAEIADIETRGRLGSYLELFLTIGILIANILGSVSNVTSFALSIISAAIPLIFFAVFFFMPETPTYYLMKDDVVMARKTLKWLRGSHYDVELELEEQMKLATEAKRNQISFIVAIKSRAALKGLIIAFGLMFIQQLCGVNAIIFYAGSIFIEAMGNDAHWSPIIVVLMQVIAVFVSTLVVDTLGRRLLLLISSVAMCITTLVLGVYFYVDDIGPSMENVRWLPFLSLCGYVFFIELGFGPIPWMMMGEIFSPQVKGIAASSACLFNWLMAFIIMEFYGDLKNAIGPYGTFWIFSVVCGAGLVFVFFVVPETNGKTLEQIQIELNSKSLWRR